MTTWAIIIFLWVMPAVVLLAALLRANLRKSARRSAEDDSERAPAE